MLTNFISSTKIGRQAALQSTASQEHLQKRLAVLCQIAHMVFHTSPAEKGERKWSEPPHAQWVFLHNLQQNL